METIVIVGGILLIGILAVVFWAKEQVARFIKYLNYRTTLTTVRSARNSLTERLMLQAHEDGCTTARAMEKIKAIAEMSPVAPDVFEAALKSRDPGWQAIGYNGLSLLNPHWAVRVILQVRTTQEKSRTFYREGILRLAQRLPVDGKGGLVDIISRVLQNSRSTYPWGYIGRDQLCALKTLLEIAVSREIDFRAIGLSSEAMIAECYSYAERLAAHKDTETRHAGEDFLGELRQLCSKQERTRREQEAGEQERRRREEEARQHAKWQSPQRSSPSDTDYYRILQVDAHAEPEVIQAAYRRLAAKYHPDRNNGSDATIRMQHINQAYEILSDPDRRRTYDESRAQS